MNDIEITKSIDVRVKLSVDEIADMFCDMDNHQQAEFFNTIGDRVKNWERPFVFQLQEIIETERLTDDGKKIMKEIGEYSFSPSVRQEKLGM